MPNLFHPDYIEIQQDRMKQFDPFCSSGSGPKIPGDRPFGPSRSTSQRTAYYKSLPEYKTYVVPARK